MPKDLVAWCPREICISNFLYVPLEGRAILFHFGPFRGLLAGLVLGKNSREYCGDLSFPKT